jgi:hypothetical protein
MKKVLITESQLRGMVRKELLNEMGGMKPTIDTPTEEMLDRIFGSMNTLKSRLKDVDQVAELDGLFETILKYTRLKLSKSQIMGSLNKALNKLDVQDGSRNNFIDTKKMVGNLPMNESRRRRY